MHKILIRPLAKNDIKKIWHYSVKNWGEKQAESYTQELSSSISVLARNPQIGSSIDHIRKNYRQYHFNQHLIIYRLHTDHIEIVRILGDHMDTQQHL